MPVYTLSIIYLISFYYYPCNCLNKKKYIFQSLPRPRIDDAQPIRRRRRAGLGPPIRRNNVPAAQGM